MGTVVFTKTRDAHLWYAAFVFSKNNKAQKRGRLSIIGRLQLASEKTAEENHNEIAVLRELRTEVLNEFHSCSSRFLIFFSG